MIMTCKVALVVDVFLVDSVPKLAWRDRLGLKLAARFSVLVYKVAYFFSSTVSTAIHASLSFR